MMPPARHNPYESGLGMFLFKTMQPCEIRDSYFSFFGNCFILISVFSGSRGYQVKPGHIHT